MQLVELSESDKSEYNKFVAANLSGSFLQSWEWGEWQKSLGREVYRYFISIDANIMASVQLVKMSLPFGKYYLYAPYGPVVNKEFRIQNDELLGQLRKSFTDAIFIRLEFKDKLLSTIHYPLITKSPNIQPAKTLIINLEKSEEDLLAEMHHKTRYNIKVAQKHGVEVKEELEISIGHGLYFKEAINLICETAKRQNFNTYPFSYYQNLVDFFVLNQKSDVKAHLYKAIYGNQLLATAVMIDFPAGGGFGSGAGTRTFLFGGSGDFHKNVMAPYLLHWQAMLDAKSQGLKFYDFWGIETSSGETPGFVRFKLGFGGEEKQFAGAYDYINSKNYYKLYLAVRFLKKIFRKLF